MQPVRLPMPIEEGMVFQHGDSGREFVVVKFPSGLLEWRERVKPDVVDHEGRPIRLLVE